MWVWVTDGIDFEYDNDGGDDDYCGGGGGHSPIPHKKREYLSIRKKHNEVKS